MSENLRCPDFPFDFPFGAEKGGRQEDLAVEVDEHPLGASLGAVDGDDAEVLGADVLNARVDDAAGLLQDIGTGLAATPAGQGSGHDNLRVKGPGKPSPDHLRRQSAVVNSSSFWLKPTYQGISTFGADVVAAQAKRSPSRATPPPSRGLGRHPSATR
jgi:hypothetical protein